jgi:hypothetical protein
MTMTMTMIRRGASRRGVKREHDDQAMTMMSMTMTMTGGGAARVCREQSGACSCEQCSV